MKPKRRQKLELFLAAIFLSMGMMTVGAQVQVSCSNTLAAWKNDRSLAEFMRTHTCKCVDENQLPKCTKNPDRRETVSPTSPTTPGPGGANITTSGAEAAARAEEERKRKDQDFKIKNEKLKVALKTGKPGNTANPGLKPSSGSVVKAQTIKRIKELNCSAFWGIQSMEIALKAGNKVTTNLEDEFTRVRQYAEFSAQARDGKSVQGCPDVKISVPDVPPPPESNPQIQFYDQLILETQQLLPEIIDTVSLKVGQESWLEETKAEKRDNDLALKKISSKPNTAANRTKKKELVSKNNELDKLLSDLGKSVDNYAKQTVELGARVAELQTKFDLVSKDPDQAQKFLNK